LELVRNAGLLADDTIELIAAEGSRCQVDATLANLMATAVEAKVADMKPGQRMLSELTIIKGPKEGGALPDARDSASYGWLLRFRDFCWRSGGFEVRGSAVVQSEPDVLRRRPRLHVSEAW
jgi:hypothetical protein